VSDYCVTPIEQFFNHIMARTSYILMMNIMSTLY